MATTIRNTLGLLEECSSPDGDYPSSSLLAQAAISAAILPGPELPNQESAHRAHAQRDTRGSSVGVRTLRQPSNQRMKLSARDHSLFCVRLGRRSLCAFRYADTKIDPQVSREHENLDGLLGARGEAQLPGFSRRTSYPVRCTLSHGSAGHVRAA